ncbi:MAG: glycosyltransferase family 2 protein [Terriglobales bacterium]
MDLSIIIVNWKSANYLRSCLSSVYCATRGIEFEVIVVDNASDDGCENIIKEEFPRARFIQSGENLGFARANNLGFAHSHGDCLLFLNPDTEIIGNALARMLFHLRANLSVGAVGARLLNTDSSLQISCVQAFPTICNQVVDSELLRRVFPNWRGWGMRPLFQHADQPAEVDAISGACFMVKRSVFEQVGMFGEQYFMYSDDLDLSYKINKRGFTIHYLNDCEVVHHGGKSSARQEDHFSDVVQRESLVRFFRVTKGPFYCGLYRSALVIAATLRMTVVAFLVATGRCLIQGKASGAVFEKWLTIFRWAIGLDHYSRTIEKTQSAL